MLTTLYAVICPDENGDNLLAVYSTPEDAALHGAHWPGSTRHLRVERVDLDPPATARSGAYGAQVDTLGGIRTYWSDTAHPGSLYGPWELNNGYDRLQGAFEMIGHFRAEAYASTPEEAVAKAAAALPEVAATA